MANGTNVIMPQMGESITEATITGWRKKVGEAVEEGEALLDISTAKVEVEIPAPASGVVAELLFAEGATVPIDTLIARIAPAGAVVAAKPAAAAQAAGSAAASPAAPASAAEAAKPACPLTQSSNGRGNGKAPSTPVEELSGDVEEQRARLMRQRSTPLVRNMAKELGVDIAEVPGSGQHGRVTRRDLESYLAERRDAPARPRPEPAPAAAKAPAPAKEAPMGTMRRMIAEHMLRSQRTSAHVYTVHEIDFTRLEKLRLRHRADFEAAHGVKLTPLAFVLKALSQLLQKHSEFNASIRNDTTVVYHGSVNLGVAVALPAGGLIVPVIRETENLSLAGLAKKLGESAGRARNGQLSPADVEGGTFTVTSPGQLGALMGTPVINQPQSAILHVGAISKTPAVVECPDGEDVIAVRLRACLTLGFDHRLIDGWEADNFMAALRERIETAEFGLGD